MHLSGGGHQPTPVKPVHPDPKPPVTLDDTSKSGFAKLVVRNLGAIVNSSDLDFAPTITADGHTMFFVTDRRGGVGVQDFWMTISPENNDTAWGGPVDVTEINSVKDDGAASIAADGQTIYFATSRNTTEPNDVNLWQATLDGTHWKNVKEVGAPINTILWESQPSISPDGKKLFFASNRMGKVQPDDKRNVDIFVSHQLPDGRWGEPVNLGSKINMAGYDASPFMAADGTTLYFCSDRPPVLVDTTCINPNGRVLQIRIGLHRSHSPHRSIRPTTIFFLRSRPRVTFSILRATDLVEVVDSIYI